MARTTKYQWYQILSFVALIVSAVVWLLNGLNVLSHLGNAGWMLMLIRDICALVAIAIGAYGMAMKMSKTWRVIYWIIIVVAIVGLVFGGLSSGGIFSL